MKPFALVVLAFCFFSCKEPSENNFSTDLILKEKETFAKIKNIEVLKSDLALNQLEGVWYYKGEPYNGYSFKFHNNNTLKERLGFYNGKREGVAKRWSESGMLREEFFYSENRLDGGYKMWWDNGVLEAETNYVNGLKEGEEKKWYPNGQLAKLRHLVDGREEGIQQAWLTNGKLYVNYEAKNGRIFGMRRANSCYKLEDEVVIRKNTK